VAVLFNPATTPPLKFYMPSIQAAASSLALEASIAAVHGRDEIEGVIAAQARNPGGGLMVMPDVFNDANRELIIALAARSGVPAIYPRPVFAESGGLIAYGADLTEQFRQAAGVRRSHPEGRKSGRSADSTADQVRARDQCQDREGAWVEHPPVHAAARRWGDRIAQMRSARMFAFAPLLG
jgi:hypothetical protein